ncbi:MAG: hypothetical protein CM1200mP38_3020 [Dehalococcoidia bacterium]|nr:MAG: hypothetical protein CM1200mP38_3020 [Dehalococcoidia bacterium]
MSTLIQKSNASNPTTWEYAAINANAVRTADPIANPLPVAALYFPKNQVHLFALFTSGSKPACSAIPPALSATGP